MDSQDVPTDRCKGPDKLLLEFVENAKSASNIRMSGGRLKSFTLYVLLVLLDNFTLYLSQTLVEHTSVNFISLNFVSVAPTVSYDNVFLHFYNLSPTDVDAEADENETNPALAGVNMSKCECADILASVFPQLVMHWSAAGNKLKTFR